MGNEFQELLEKYDIKHHTTAARFPQANGLAEVKMKSIVPAIVTSLDFQEERWDKDILKVERNLNNMVNRITNYTF